MFIVYANSKSSHVSLTNDKDVLVWNLSKSCLYTPKKGYVQLLLDRDGMDHSCGGNYYGSLSALSRKKSFVGFFYLIKHLPGIS